MLRKQDIEINIENFNVNNSELVGRIEKYEQTFVGSKWFTTITTADGFEAVYPGMPRMMRGKLYLDNIPAENVKPVSVIQKPKPRSDSLFESLSSSDREFLNQFQDVNGPMQVTIKPYSKSKVHLTNPNNTSKAKTEDLPDKALKEAVLEINKGHKGATLNVVSTTNGTIFYKNGQPIDTNELNVTQLKTKLTPGPLKS